MLSPAPPKAPASEGVTVGFCRGGGIFSRAIEWFGAGYYSHVTTLLPDRQYVIDARLNGGVARRPLSYLKNVRIDWYTLVCNPAEQAKVYSFLYSQIGKKYDVQGIVDFVTGYNRDANWSKRSAWFCDELAAASWIYAGIAKRPFPEMPVFRITPGGSALICSQLNCRVANMLRVRVKL